jgi:hypothetical protein
MSRLSNITAAADALSALSPEDRAIALEHSGVRRRKRGGAKPGPKPGSTRKAKADAEATPTTTKKKKKKAKVTAAPDEEKAAKAKRLISEGA